VGLIGSWLAGIAAGASGGAVRPLPQAVRRGSWVYRTTQGSTAGVHRHYVRVLERFERSLMRAGDVPGLRVWGQAGIPRRWETQHLLILGMSGAGKTSGPLWPLLQQLLARGDRVILWDAKASYAAAMAPLPQVRLVAPWDRRSIVWDVAADVRSCIDAQEFAKTLVPPVPGEKDPYWRDSARRIVESLVSALQASGGPWGWKELWAPIEAGKEALAAVIARVPSGQAAAALIDGDRTSANDVYSTLVSVASTSLRWLAAAWPSTARGLSLRNWVESDDPGQGLPRVLVIPGLPRFGELAGMTARLVLETVAREALSLPDDLERRIWLFCDEFSSLGRVDAVARAGTEGRSRGLCLVVGIQDLARVEAIWGREIAQTLANVFSTIVVMRCGDPATAEWASKVLGEQEVDERYTTRSTSTSSKGWFDASNTDSRQEHARIAVQRAVLPAEVMHLPDRVGILRIPNWPLFVLAWPLSRVPQVAATIELAPWAAGVETLLPAAPRAREESGRTLDVLRQWGR